MTGGRTAVMAAIAVLALAAASCSTARRARTLSEKGVSAGLRLPEAVSSPLPEIFSGGRRADTVRVTGLDGEELYLMRAVRDDDGEMVAADVLDAAVVTARFRNVAERGGSVDISFEIDVPAEMTGRSWQLRFMPELYAMGDSSRLEPVLVTGQGYRKAQLRGYEHYDRFIRSIIQDTTLFTRTALLERFLRRNMPEIYAFREDTTLVSETEFLSKWGVSQEDALRHYTSRWLLERNRRRRANAQQRMSRYVRIPIETEGVRLDTVLGGSGAFRYVYTQSVATRPGMRRIDIVLSGEILEGGRRIYTMERSEPLSFYVSSLSSLTDHTPRYLTRVIERRAEAGAEFRIEFGKGSDRILEDYGQNRVELSRMRADIRDVLGSDVFVTDSVRVTASASPEGSLAVNRALASGRSRSVTALLQDYMRHVRDSLAGEGFSVDESGKVTRRGMAEIPVLSTYVAEDWETLGLLVAADPEMDMQDREDYSMTVRSHRDPDRREAALQGKTYYSHLRESLYPRVRTVSLEFHMHRRGMVKDTVHTTEPDTVYMRGVEMLDSRDWEGALERLAPYGDYNTAVAYAALGRDASALAILETLESTAAVNYMAALCYSREGRIQEALQRYTLSCAQDASFISRGNLDPEISALIREYGLNRYEDGEDMP